MKRFKSLLAISLIFVLVLGIPATAQSINTENSVVIDIPNENMLCRPMSYNS